MKLGLLSPTRILASSENVSRGKREIQIVTNDKKWRRWPSLKKSSVIRAKLSICPHSPQTTKFSDFSTFSQLYLSFIWAISQHWISFNSFQLNFFLTLPQLYLAFFALFLSLDSVISRNDSAFPTSSQLSLSTLTQLFLALIQLRLSFVSSLTQLCLSKSSVIRTKSSVHTAVDNSIFKFTQPTTASHIFASKIFSTPGTAIYGLVTQKKETRPKSYFPILSIFWGVFFWTFFHNLAMSILWPFFQLLIYLDAFQGIFRPFIAFQRFFLRISHHFWLDFNEKQEKLVEELHAWNLSALASKLNHNIKNKVRT